MNFIKTVESGTRADLSRFKNALEGNEKKSLFLSLCVLK